jgi:AraC-like DNA-binding protein
VDTLAAVANMSASRFYPAFKDALGATPVDYLNHYRVNRAMTLLVNETELSVEEISMRVGFESSTYFRRVFKRITGKTPKDYRKISAEV